MNSLRKFIAFRRQVVFIKGYSKNEQESKLTNEKMSNYIDFFKSNAGGAYEMHEIQILNSPSVVTLKTLMKEQKHDFVIVVFIGHGATSSGKQLFKLNENEIIQAGQLDMDVEKQLILIGSCRNENDKEIQVTKLNDKIPNYREGGIFRNQISRNESKRLYNQQIKSCEKGSVVCFACSINELAAGYFFLDRLIQIAFDWHNDLRNYGQILNIKDLMKVTTIQVADLVLKNRGKIQIPSIMGQNDFPFVICKY
jgi:hypothetical protein